MTNSRDLYRRRVLPVAERVLAGAALVACSPVLAVIALAILAESGRPILFRQTRVGRHGHPFTLLKFRSMRCGMEGSPITAGADPRVTPVGAMLRRYKLDELPQLWNIFAGDMQFIGPRPELPSFVDPGEALWREVLTERPGLTDFSTLVYRDEEGVLSRYADPDRAYRERVLPHKLRLSAFYIGRRSAWTDLKLLLLTARYSFFPAGFDAERITRTFMENPSK
jgi:lipopolysaccharide/colanic/teichoic acid biosynthesis glycosyltransferase